MNKVPPRYMRLRDNHPTMVKLSKLFIFADELGISIDFNSNGPARLYDKDFIDGQAPLTLADIENPDYPMDNFPCTLEYKLTYENPAYLQYLEDVRRAQEAEAEAKRLERERLTVERKAKEVEQKLKEKKARRVKRIVNLQARLQKDQAELRKLQQLTK